MVDPHQFESAILNLALNARDAMPNGGNLSMTLDNCRCVDRVSPPISTAPTTTSGCASATPAAVSRRRCLPHVFEPFFTTKGPGEGSGLGLSMVYGFINQSGGRVVLTSVLGRGTTAEILLPRALEGGDGFRRSRTT